MTGKALYALLAWVPEDLEERYLAWLDNGHIADVVAEPGFIGARRARLTQVDSDGRRGHLILYDIATPADLDAYLRSETRQRYVAEGRRNFPQVTLQRFDGGVSYQI